MDIILIIPYYRNIVENYGKTGFRAFDSYNCVCTSNIQTTNIGLSNYISFTYKILNTNSIKSVEVNEFELCKQPKIA